jgi:Zn-dependent membrane protease YugP
VARAPFTSRCTAEVAGRGLELLARRNPPGHPNQLGGACEAVYAVPSVAAAGVTAHEVGHALQDATAYASMRLRQGLVPVAGPGSNVDYLLFLSGVVSSFQVAAAGFVLFSGTALFAAVTLPVELNASNRAMQLLNANGLVTPQDAGLARTVLDAAALTYAAGLAQALSQLLYFGSLLLGMRRSED